MMGRNIKLIALAALQLTLGLQAFEFKNDWDQSVFLVVVPNSGEATFARVDGKNKLELPNVSSSNTAIVGVGAWVMKRHGEGYRDHWYYCGSESFIFDKIDGSKLSGMKRVMINKKDGAFQFTYQ